MTEQTTETATGTEEAADAALTAEQTSTEDTDDGKRGNPEAAKWRTKYRDAEATISTLAERVTSMQRAEVVRLATGAGKLIDGEDVFRSADLTDLLTDDGDVDPEAVSEAVAALRASKPHLTASAFGDGVGIGERNPAGTKTWADVLGT